MATAECVNRPLPSHSGTNRGNPANSGTSNSEQQGPGLHPSSQDPGLSSQPQPHIPPHPRPFFYMYPAPPPPLLHYQWPMPIPYNPFAGFPGMGYGVVMPPLPPNPYMEAPGYILPHPHIQPVDYRRMLHPQVPAGSAPYQHQNPNRRFRPQYNVPVVRETVNSEVQTEPALTTTIGSYGARSPLASSESGHGTNSTSPSSSNSSTGKQGDTEVENYILPSSNTKENFLINREIQDRGTAKDGFKTPPPASEKIQSHLRTPLEPQKSMVPVCSSSDRENNIITKERRVSFPDILMSWGSSTPPATALKMVDKMLSSSKDQLASSEETEAEHEKMGNVNLTEQKSSPVAVDGKDTKDIDTEHFFSCQEHEAPHKILKLPFTIPDLLSESKKENESAGLVVSLRTCIPSRQWGVSHERLDSLNESQKVPDADQENCNESFPLEKTTEIIPHQMSFSYVQIKRKLNESVWSVESLAPYIPSQDWLVQNGVLEPDVIIEEIAMNDENGGLSTHNDYPIDKVQKERRRSRRFSSDFLPVPTSWLGDQCKVNCHNRFPLASQPNVDVFSTPAEKLDPEKKPDMQCKVHPSQMEGKLKQGPSMEPPVKDSLASPPLMQSEMGSSTEKDADKSGSSEPGANQSLNQKSLIVIEQQEQSPCSPELVEIPLSNPLEGEKSPTIGQLSLHKKEVIMEQKSAVCGNEEASELTIVKLGVKVAYQKLSPSKGDLVDCGVQCSEFQEVNCPCKELKNGTGVRRKSPLKQSDLKKANRPKAAVEANENGYVHKNYKRHGHWRNRQQDRQQTQSNQSNKLFLQDTNQEEAYSGYYSKPGKTKGGNGRNQRY
uniref:Uncharacterized protein n=1 Tax=Myripristis murdjan TaxID=586833 RepID=A0A668AQG0_9TELE